MTIQSATGSDQAARKVPEIDRRAFPRQRAKGIGCCRFVNRPFDPRIRGRLVDISQGGVGLRLPQPFQPGDVIEIEMESPTGARTRCVAEVRWASQQPDGEFRVGCRWEHHLAFADLQKFT
jgi:hypothetical protein